jgi:hypothetical protein
MNQMAVSTWRNKIKSTIENVASSCIHDVDDQIDLPLYDYPWYCSPRDDGI